MGSYLIRVLVGMTWFAIGLFWSPLAILGFVFMVVKNGPGGVKALLSAKPRTKLPEVGRNPRYIHEQVKTKSGVVLHCVQAGSKNNPLMLCMHGFPECWYGYHYVLDHFSDRFHVVAFDLRGYGDSDKPKSIGEYHIDYLMNDAQELVYALGHQKATIVANDWGGIIAWNIPHFFPEVVERLIVLNGPHDKAIQDFMKASWSQFFKSWYIFLFQLPWIPELLISVMDDDDINKSATGIQNPAKKLSRQELDMYKYSTEGNMTHALNYYRAKNPLYVGLKLRCKTKVIKQPVLVIWGAKDPVLDKGMVPFHKKYVENLHVKIIEEASHMVLIDQPEQVHDAIEKFLEATK
uniref:Epoxide hydrolase 3 n=1 Tax=Phallusia mammillata TaxID=59560 RepID=A0A6F9DBI3_9ASCI|nr:epoxide hydrolase 3 [Phallusia mammillata]